MPPAKQLRPSKTHQINGKPAWLVAGSSMGNCGVGTTIVDGSAGVVIGIEVGSSGPGVEGNGATGGLPTAAIISALIEGIGLATASPALI